MREPAAVTLKTGAVLNHMAGRQVRYCNKAGDSELSFIPNADDWPGIRNPDSI